MTEKALSITPFDNPEPNILKKFDRIYIGSNSCTNLIPEIKDIKKLKELGITKITIQTPLLTDNDFEKVSKLIKETLKIFERIEISANDIAILDKFKSNRRIDLLIGRPISHDWLRMDIDMLKKFIKKFRIKYIEADEKMMIEKFKPHNIAFTFHYPFEYLAITRICPFERKLNNTKCTYKCIKKNIVELHNSSGNGIIYLKNNSYFKKNELFKSKNIKRTVLMYYGQKI